VASGTVTLNTGVDTDDAFQMFVEYLYHSNYNPPGEAGRDSDCLLHVRVYVLAERLCMEDLKSLAFKKLFKELVRDEQYMSGTPLPASTVAQLAEPCMRIRPVPMLNQTTMGHVPASHHKKDLSVLAQTMSRLLYLRTNGTK
jgi:hypothetical protein